MKSTLVFALLFIVLSACELFEGDTSPVNKDTATAVQNIKKINTDFVNNANQFSFNLMDKVLASAPSDKNLLISPLSINIALGMLYNGADGNSAQQIVDALGFDTNDTEAINANYKNLISALPNLSNQVDVSIANSVWHDQNFVVKDQFLQNLANSFDAEINGEDFSHSSTPEKINNWVDQNTNGKIKKILDSISAQEVMFLINALYFNGKWKNQFDPDKTTNQTFTNEGGAESSVKMMMLDDIRVKTTNRDGYSIFELPYGEDERYALRILLPNRDKSLDDIFNSGSKLAWNEAMELGGSIKTTVGFPKFEIKDEYQLNDILKSLGITDVFEAGKANLNNISDSQLNVSQVKHKTFMKVDEAGTEAAAVTSIGIEVTSLPPAFICDRPFAFYIYEQEMGNILFMGRISKLD